MYSYSPAQQSVPRKQLKHDDFSRMKDQLEKYKIEYENVPSRPNGPAPPPTTSSFSRTSDVAFPAHSNTRLPMYKEFRVPTYRAVLARKGYLIRNTLGSGTYSKVKSAYYVKSNEFVSAEVRKVAVKIIDREKAPYDYQANFLPRELRIWPTLSHPSIIHMLDHFTDGRRVYMILEYANQGDCLKYVQKMGALSEPAARNWLYQVCDAVRYLHNMNLAHRDLKLENLLLDSRMRIKICDFGFVKHKTSVTELSRTYCGSKSYAAPEILKGCPYDPKKSDIWAIGVILYIFVTGKMPYDESKGNKRILEHQLHLDFAWPSTHEISNACKKLIVSMFTFEYQHRPDIQEVLRCGWFGARQSSRLAQQALLDLGMLPSVTNYQGQGDGMRLAGNNPGAGDDRASSADEGDDCFCHGAEQERGWDGVMSFKRKPQ